MAARPPRPELVAIVGPTASGKSELAMRIAREFNGEIICADSRTIYKCMDIGTAKPSAQDQKAIKHWGLDLVEPGQSYSVAKFKAYAQKVAKDINNRSKFVVLVGGTGLYVDAVLYDFAFSPAGSPRDPLNPRHLKKSEDLPRRRGLRPGALLVGLLPPDEEIRQRITDRAQAIFDHRVVQETEVLVKKYGPDKIQRTAGIENKIAIRLITGEITEEQAIELFKTADWQYARRQKTWFKRNLDIRWFDSAQTAYGFLTKKL